MATKEGFVTQQGRVTIPAEIRQQLGIQPGDYMRFEVEGDAIRLTHVKSKILEHFGSVTPINRPEDWEAIREEFEIGVAEEAH